MNVAGQARAHSWGGHGWGSAAIVTRTALVMAALVALLAIGGWAFGGYRGMYLMVIVGLIINFFSYWFSDRIALRVHRARPVSQAEAPRLYEVVGELARRADIPMPPLYVIPSPSPNAFATGRGPKHSAVAVTEGLLQIMDERELTGVLAHELSHVKNRDVLVATIAAGIAGVVSSLGYVLQIGLIFGGGGGRDRRDSGLAAIAWIIVAPIVALLLQLALSRAREYGADESGARLTNDPDGLASALAQLETASQRIPYGNAGPATAHLFIVNPLHGGAGRLLNLLSSHPPIEQRIARLRAMR